VGVGYSAVSVSDGRAYTMGSAGNQDVVWCLDAETGRELWKFSYPCAQGQYPGARATPTVAEGRVYTLSCAGHAYCLNAGTGAVVWARDLRAELRVQPPGWGFAGSPLLIGDLVILNVGGAGVALKKDTGAVAWEHAQGNAGYASPVAFAMEGKPCVAIFTAAGLAGLDAASGKVLWTVPWKTAYDVNASDPLMSSTGNKAFITSGYDTGCEMIEHSPAGARVLWRTKALAMHFATPLYVDGHFYGVSSNAGATGALRCVDVNTGAVVWSQPMPHGSVIAAGGRLIILTERGDLICAEATPERYKELGKARVLDGTCWTAPVLANGRIYCRNDRGRVICLDVRAAEDRPR
jgi:outer membrane protein assembly factor BamB